MELDIVTYVAGSFADIRPMGEEGQITAAEVDEILRMIDSLPPREPAAGASRALQRIRRILLHPIAAPEARTTEVSDRTVVALHQFRRWLLQVENMQRLDADPDMQARWKLLDEAAATGTPLPGARPGREVIEQLREKYGT